MKNNSSFQKEITLALLKIGNKKCLAKAKIFESELPPLSSLNLRDLDLNESNITLLIHFLKLYNDINHTHLTSISFSYNPQLGDTGVIDLVQNLPLSIRELGLVNCGMHDKGGIEILNWMRNAPLLQMVCVEQNNFSNKLRNEFEKYKRDNPQTVLVY